MNKLDSTSSELLNMLKAAEGAFKKEKSSSLLECLGSRIRRIRVLSLKQTNLSGASRKIRAFVIIMKKKDIEGGIARNTLQLFQAKKLNKASTSGMLIIVNYLTTLHYCS